MKLTTLAGTAGVAVAICAVCGHVPGQFDPPPSEPTHTSVPAVNYTDTSTSGSVPPDPNFPCEDFSHGSPPVCTPEQAQVLIDRNCAQSRAEGDDCGIDTDKATGMRYAYNIQSPEHAAETKAKADEMSQKICAALTKDGGTCNVVVSDP